MRCGEIADVPVQLLYGVAEQISSQGLRVGEQEGRIKGDFSFRLPAKEPGQNPARLRREVLVGLANRTGGAQDRLPRGWVHPLPDAGQELQAEVVSRRRAALVAGVDAVGQPMALHVVDHLIPAHVEERPDDADPPDPPADGHAAKPSKTRAAQEAKQDRLGLIVRRMRGGDSIGTRVARQLSERFVPRQAGRFLRGWAKRSEIRRDVRNSPRRRQVADERRVAVRLDAPEPVVHVRGDERRRVPGARPERGEEVEERDRVGSPGNRHQKRCAGRQEPMIFDRSLGEVLESRVPWVRFHGSSIAPGRGRGPGMGDQRCKLVAAQGFEPRTKRL